MLLQTLAILLSISQLTTGSAVQDKQSVLSATDLPNASTGHVVDEAILTALKTYSDPVDALISLQPEAAGELAQPRLLHVFGDKKPKWMTEGDKLRLRRAGRK